MKNKILKTSLIALLLIVMMQVIVFAAINLTFTMKTDKNEYKVGDTVTATVDWEKGMQSASFKVTYDNKYLTFDSASIGNNYYSATDNSISVNWAAFDGKDCTKMTFVFKAKATTDSTTIKISDAKDFVNGDMQPADSISYKDNGIKNIKITNDSTQQPDQKPEEKPTQTPSTSDDKKEEQKPTQNPATTDKKDNTVAEGKMPQTGAETTTIVAIFALSVLGIVGFIGYRRLSDI